MALSPGGTYLGVFTFLGVYVYRTSDLSLWDYLPGEDARADFAFTPDGKSMLFGKADIHGNNLNLLDLESRQLRESPYKTALHGNYNYFLSPDGHTIVVDQYEVQIRDLQDGEREVTLISKNSVERGYSPTAYDYSDYSGGSPCCTIYGFTPDGKMVLTYAKYKDKPLIQLWDVASGNSRFDLEATPSAAAISPDGSLLAYLVNGQDLKIIRVNTHEIVHSFPAATLPAAESLNLAFSPDGTLFTDGLNMYTIRDWMQTGLMIPAYKLQAFSSGWEARAFQSQDGRINFTTSTSQEILFTSDFRQYHLCGNASSSDRLAVSEAGVMQWLDPISGQLMPGDQNWNGCYEQFPVFSSNGKYVVTVSGVMPFLLDASSLQVLKDLSDLCGNRARVFAFSTDSTHLACSAGQYIKILEISTGTILKVENYNQAYLAFSPKRQISGSGELAFHTHPGSNKRGGFGRNWRRV
jgi:WD40 repeat protein